MIEFVRFMAKVPTEYLPRVQRVILDAAGSLGLPRPDTSASLHEDLQKIQLDIKNDAIQALTKESANLDNASRRLARQAFETLGYTKDEAKSRVEYPIQSSVDFVSSVLKKAESMREDYQKKLAARPAQANAGPSFWDKTIGKIVGTILWLAVLAVVIAIGDANSESGRGFREGVAEMSARIKMYERLSRLSSTPTLWSDPFGLRDRIELPMPKDPPRFLATPAPLLQRARHGTSWRHDVVTRLTHAALSPETIEAVETTDDPYGSGWTTKEIKVESEVGTFEGTVHKPGQQ